MLYVELLVVFCLTLVNGLLALSEMAVASSRLPKLRALASQNVKGSRRAIALASDPGRFLSTVQIGITLVGVLAGAVSGATLGKRLALQLEAFGLANNFAEAIGFGLVISGITYLSLIIGELVPKQIALRNPERLACLVAPGMTLLAKIASPIVWFLDRSGRVVLTLLGQGGVKTEIVTDAEIHSLIAEAESAGVIEPEERSMISGVMKLGDKPVKAVMIPRSDVEMIDANLSLADAKAVLAKSKYSRVVAYDGNPDNVMGVIQLRDVALETLRGRVPKLKKLVREAPVFPDSVDAIDAIERLKEAPIHLGIVVDEYGNFEGIVTKTDMLEAIMGAFREDRQPAEPEMVERDNGSLLVSGWAAIDSVMPKLGLKVPEHKEFHTMAGFVLDQMGRLPKVGESFTHAGLSFEVVDLDGRRIDKILVSRSTLVARRARR